ncbi:MAG: DUF2309 domain-containing protein [Acidimicrobiales bacterium]
MDLMPRTRPLAVAGVATPAFRPAALDRDRVEQALRTATALVAPLWPLEDFVAVNPYLGLVDRPARAAMAELERVGGGWATMPASFYLEALSDGRLALADVAEALAAWPTPTPGVDAVRLVEQARRDPEREADDPVPTVADVASRVTGRDWSRLRTDRVSAWAAAHHDDGQASWRSVDPRLSLFASWKAEASIDRTPEIMGLRGFRAFVRALPDDPVAAAQVALARIGVPERSLDRYLHAALRRMGGWAAFVACRPPASPGDDVGADPSAGFLAVLLAWEAGLLEALASTPVPAEWERVAADLAPGSDGAAPDTALGRRLVLHAAYDLAASRRLVAGLAATSPSESRRGDGTTPTPDRPRAQLVFCIDVRSEVLRRHLEAVAADVDTLGFAGFFGLPIEVVPLAHEHGTAQCPVLLAPGHAVAETVPGAGATEAAADRRRRTHHRRRAWKSFKMGAISCFSFVGPVGLAYLPKLFRDGFGRAHPVPSPAVEGLDHEQAAGRGPSLDPVPSVADGLPLDVRIDMAEGALRGMSLTSGFAPLVVFTGHGSTTVNNPYASGLDCGACGGHAGDVNARVAAAILADPAVRAALADRGIAIPDDTTFVAALHDTTTDDVRLFDLDQVPAAHRATLAALVADLAEAGRRARAERAGRLGIATDDATPDQVDALVRRRSTDWAQVRPEWGLAGCRAFVAAPRSRTRSLDLGGRAFLHSYDWQADDGFGVLETILTAPVVVASWISLQYCASTLDNERLGSGNKVIHNVVGSVGVLEGNGGDLRSGLPWQSVHDGTTWQHDPVHLSVVVEAPIDALDGVLADHPEIRALYDNGWLHLLAMDDSGRIVHRYVGEGRWIRELADTTPMAA